MRGKIEDAYKSGKLSHDEYVLNLLFNIVDRTKLDKEFQEEIPGIEKCGTSTFLKLREENKTASSFVQNEINKVVARPTKQKYLDSPKGYFRIHFDTSGTHAVYLPSIDTLPQNGIPDYVDRTSEIFDRVWEYEIDTLGYDPPAPDGASGGGMNLFDIYLHKNAGAYGVTYTETFFPGYLGRGGYSSYIHVDPAYQGFGYPDRTLPMKVTAAHEFFHAIQFVYNANAGSWLLEITATWMEDIVYDDIDDYSRFYLNVPSGVFLAPHNSLLLEDGAHEYSACIFAHHVSESYGVSAIHKVWEETIGGVSGEIALDSALTSYGTNLADVYANYCVWNYFTGSRANTNLPHYSEGASYPQTLIHRRTTNIPFELTNEALAPLSALGAYNLKIIGNHLSGSLDMTFGDPIGNPYRGKFILDSARNYSLLSFDISSGEGSISLPQWQNVDSIIFIPAFVATNGSGVLFGYNGSIAPSGVSNNNGIPLEYSLKQNFPNPFNPATTIHFALPEKSFVTLNVFNVLGEHIATLLSEQRTAGVHSVRWEPNNLQSGVYFYKLQTEKFSSVKKLMLVK